MIRLIAILALVWASGASAQSNCADRDAVAKGLVDKFGEQRIGAGVQNARRIFEIWISEDTGTWTVLMVRADGQPCIMASGQSWREYKPVAVIEGVPG